MLYNATIIYRMSEAFLKSLRENWIFIIFIGGLVAGWTSMGSDISTLQNKVQTLEAKDSERAAQIASINVQLSSISTKLDFIKEKLDK